MASRGDPKSQFYLGSQTVRLSPLEKHEWLLKSAHAGHVTAQHNLAMGYMGKDDEEAIRWFTLAADQGNTFSLQMLNSIRAGA